MGVILKPSLWCPGIDLSHPLANGLVGCWAMQEGDGKILNLANPAFAMTAINSPAWQSGECGPEQLFDDAANEFQERQSAILTAAPITLMAWFNSDDDAKAGDLISIGESGGSSDNRFRLISGGNVAGDPIRANTRGGAVSGTANSTTGFTQGKRHQGTAVFHSPTDRRAYIDGGSEGTNATNLTPSGSDNTRIGDVIGATGAGVGSGINEFSGSILLALIWARALTAGQIADLYRDPCQFLRPSPIILPFSAAVQGGGAASPITGTSAGTSTASGALTGSGALAGDSPGTSTSSGAATGAGALSGTLAGVGAASGAITGAGALTGTSAGTGAASGAMTGAGALAGTSAGVATASGALTQKPLELSGTYRWDKIVHRRVAPMVERYVKKSVHRRVERLGEYE